MSENLFDLIKRLIGPLIQSSNAIEGSDVTAMAQLGAESFGEKRVVEAVFWMVMADLKGFPNLTVVLRDYTATWVQMGSPEQCETISRRFCESQREFGYAALLWFSKNDEETARKWFTREAKNGNDEARDFIKKYGLATPLDERETLSLTSGGKSVVDRAWPTTASRPDAHR